MKTIKLFLTLIGIILFNFSCSTSSLLTSDVKPIEVNEMLKFECLSYISLIEKGNKMVYNDSISKKTKTVVNEFLENYREKLLLSSGEIILKDSLNREKVESEISYLLSTAVRNKNIKTIPITPLIDSILTLNEKRFGLIVVHSGFTRDKGNYGNQIAKGIGMGILTLGMYYQTPIKASSVIYALILDSEKKNIAFYNKSVSQNPTEKENIVRQLHEVFENYFWEKQ